MALQFNQSRRSNWKLNVTSGAVVIGATYLLFRTFPHLGTSISELLLGTKEDKNARKDSIESNANDENHDPVELKSDESSVHSLEESAVDITQSQVDVAEWSNANLKSWLGEKDINTPSNTSHDNLVALVKSIQETSNDI